MNVTISTHNGTAVAREHNIRNEKVVSKEKHIDPNGIHEIWIDEPVRQAYERLFGESVRKYNDKQNRTDRKIDSYYNNICKDKKKHPVYEMIIGIYGKSEDGSPVCSSEQGKEIMRQFVENWQERNPNLELIGAYYHADEEGEPHVHLDYVPVAHGYKKGMDTQNGLVKALGEQGFEKIGKATAQIQWEKRENDYLASLCESIGLTVEHPRIEGIEHLETQRFKLSKRVDELEQAEKIATERFLNADIKADEAEERANSAELNAKDAEQRIYKAETELEPLQKAVADAQARLEELEGRIMKQSEVNALKGKKSLTGALKGVSYEEYLSLKKTANRVKSVDKEKKQLKAELDKEKKRADEAEQRAIKAEKDKEARFSRKKIEEMAKVNDLENKNRVLCQVLGIPENANYDETRRQLKDRGLLRESKKRGLDFE